jgi:PAS domain S-box-containing protein
MFKFKRQIWSYGAAIASTIIAALLMLVLDPYTDLTKASFLLFFGAVTISAWYGGRGPGILATLLSALCANYFFVEPVQSLSLTVATGARVAIFVLQGCLISALVGSLRIAQQQTKESLRQLKASEAKFRRLVDSNIIGVVSADIYGKIVDANDAFLNSVGYTHEDLLAGQIRLDEMTPADLKDIDIPAYEELITKGKNTPYEKVYIGKQGQRVSIVIGTALLEDDPKQVISFILDVSDRKRAEAERERLLQTLAAERAQFEAVLRQMPEGVMIADAASGNLVLSNEQANQILRHAYALDLELEQYEPRVTFQAYRPDGRRYAADEYPLVRSLRTGEVVSHEEMEIRHQDGSCIFIDTNSSAIFNSQGQIISAVVVFQDITQRKQTEAALRESERRLHLLANNVPSIIWTAAPDGTITWASDAWYAYTGITPQQNARDWPLVLHPDDFERCVIQWRQALEQGLEYAIEVRNRRHDGEYRWFLTQAVPMRDDAGHITTWFGSTTDIHERKLTEEARRQMEDRLRVALKSAPINTFSQDRELRYTWIENPTFDYQVDRVLGKKDSDFVCPEEAAILTRIKQQVLETGIGKREEVKLTHSGREYYYDLTIEPMQDANGAVIGVICAAIDISELKQTELALRQSEERFRLLAERVHVIPWEVDPMTGQFTYVGPQAIEILGYPLEAWYADNFWIDHIYFPDREWVPKFCYESSLSLDNYDFEYRMLAADGRIVWLYDVVNVVRYEKDPKLLRGIMIDITQRKQQEDAQQYLAEVSKVLASSLDYQTTLNQLAHQMVPHLADWCTVHILEEDGSILPVATAHVNPEKVKWADEIRQRYPLNPDNQRGTPQVLRTGQSEIYPNIPDALLVEVAYDSEHLHLLRQVGFRSAMIVPMQAHGKTLGTLTLVAAESGRCYDQTDLTLAEELARRAALAVDNARLYKKTQQAQQIAERFASRTAVLQQITAAFSQALTPQQIADVVMQQGITALGASAGSIALLVEQGTALKILQAVGYPESMVNHWSSFPISAPIPIAETARTGEPLFLETDTAALLKYPHLADSIATTGNQAFACLPLTVEARLIGVMGLSFGKPQAFDPEERAFMLTLAQQSAQAIARAQLYEAEQTARSAAEAANRVKDEFLAVLSHELRTPLNPILGWSKLLQTGNLDEAKTAQALSIIARNAKLQAELIEDLLDVSRILRGKLSLNICPVDLALTIQAAMETVRLSALAKSIDIHTMLEPDVGLVSGDSSRLQQVVWNLLSNAIKFTPPGGRVEIRLERVENMETRKHGDTGNMIENFSTSLLKYAQITISDTGKGIHPDFLSHVFDYFRQEDGATTRKFGGLGLGLAIVRHLVELHGGTVQAESPGEGQGATFTVRLPLMPTSPQISQDSKPSESALDLTGIQVLVVDDNIDTREFVAFLIEQYGANVISVGSAREALVALANSKPDVLLSDIGMPEVDGYMLMRQVRALPPEQGGQIPAIALTAYAGEYDQQQALEAGFQQHVPKPVEPEVLIRAISTLLRNTGCGV